jgi:hypothetical protein
MHDYVHDIVARWDGGDWTVTWGVYQGVLGGDDLTGVACPTTTRCEAVGSTAVDSDTVEPLVARWNGRRWALQQAANPPGASRGLHAVSCTTARKCLAVGNRGDALLAESWNGRRWSIVRPADPDASYAGFGGVACVRARRCVAVGGAGVDVGRQLPLIEIRHGSTWSVVAAPSIDAQAGVLESVACATPSRCFAVGAVGTAGHTTPLVLTGPS